MTDTAIIAASLTAERNYSHNPDDVIDASDAVGAWGNTKESTTELSDLSGNSNVAEIHGAMPTEGFIQGRRFDGDYLDCGNDSFDLTEAITIRALVFIRSFASSVYDRIVWKHNPSDVNQGTTFSLHLGYSNQLVGFTLSPNNSGFVVFSNTPVSENTLYYITATYNSETSTTKIYINGTVDIIDTSTFSGQIALVPSEHVFVGKEYTPNFSGNIIFVSIYNHPHTDIDEQIFFNPLARLPFWSVNYTDYPDNVTEYTDNLPYSSSIISSGTFKVDDDKLQCVSAGTITYRASYEFDGSEYIKVEIDGVEYAGTGTITQGNTTVSVAQGSNKITIMMGTGNTIDKIDIQFREEV